MDASLFALPNVLASCPEDVLEPSPIILTHQMNECVANGGDPSRPE